MASIEKIPFTEFFNTINNELTTTPTTRHGINPATRQPNPEVPVSTAEDLNRAVKHARAAFKTWSKLSVEDRRSTVIAFGEAIESHAEEFTKLLVQEQGKAQGQAAIEIGMCGTWAKQIPLLELNDVVLQDTEDQRVIQRFTPMGVVAGIVPWNFPVLLAVGKLVPAVYAGNTIIIKPSPFTPYCGLKLGELAAKIFPPGVVQVLSDAGDLGPLITAHPDINKISFTGSTLTGKRIMAACANSLKSLTLELGGNDPAIICDDVDIETVVPQVATLSFLVSAQVCMMIKRLYVHEKIYDKFLEALVAFTRNLKVGDGAEPGVFFGPVQNEMQYEKVKDLLTSIQTENLTPVLGGTVTESAGYFITPTIIDNPPENSRVVQEEAFGPILPVLKWSQEDDVIARANDVDTGLGASVWSADLDRAEKIARQLESGSVWINSHFQVAPHVPFGA
ncbi:aldehyde dehydrogenase [Aspergillus heteromorphus CBS 117.55]|uniref:aldehyde dehydrogenase (NAD(+)) n=1 Tax=Aspergillus heteromorphus CBS 117.55 TaxID=1448321 RepID=A0A317X3J4_9EURO|nr:aldehyde dehydrogenase [Aspergillus heteromorphus CBS 117.55]PWY92192.1 aldehyde dehydrogenase [Aspergillus heteromorphus CBS 117.55]